MDLEIIIMASTYSNQNSEKLMQRKKETFKIKKLKAEMENESNQRKWKQIEWNGIKFRRCLQSVYQYLKAMHP